ncbi:hypothetical protein [uncultured Marixanthomonas sp.]|uniref:hypothetical protein n=1 Tax=uncultured Marixanthomonas sp. TaxID=757245 RepID=UPI0030DCF026|tara:strand:- start:40119 stop:40649 length:531 start_codon:yes stop_codon:yes gene_type:complete
MKKYTINILLLLFITSIAYSQTRDFKSFDRNSDKSIDQTEFNEGYSNTYNTYDTDRDGKISDREFYDASFNRMDRDQDGNLNEDEWEKGFDKQQRDYLPSNPYSKFDQNKDQQISQQEYRDSFTNSDYYDSYDTNKDGAIDRDELNKRTLSAWDKNRDGTLDENEFNEYHPYYIDN